MIQNKTKKVCAALTSAAVAVGMTAGSFVPVIAADGSNGQPARQTNSSDTATITLEKTLTALEDNKFPNIKNFNFSFERVQAWNNDNESTNKQGKTIDKSDIPMPDVEGQTGDKYNIAVGDYSKEAAAGPTQSADTKNARSRHKNLDIKYTKAGYYVYKVNEVNDKATGVTYDKDGYYVVVYVANKVDEKGNTTNGVYVSDITVWQNDALSSIKNLNDGNEIKDPDIGTNEDANEKVSNNDGTAHTDGSYTESTKGKVKESEETPGTDGDPDNPGGGDRGTGESTGPNKIGVNFDNLSSSNDVVISKNVKGSLGDNTKLFRFKVELSGLVGGTTYQLSSGTLQGDGTFKYGRGDESKVRAIQEDETGDDAKSETKTFTASNPEATDTINPLKDGTATFTCWLKDDESLKIEGLPVGATYKVTEAASDHIADLKAEGTGVSEKEAYAAPDRDKNSNNKVKETSGAAIIATGTDGNGIAKNTEKNTALSTETETVNATDGEVTVAYTNTRNLQTQTGIPDMAIPFVGAGIAALIALLATKRRKNKSTLAEM